MRLLWLNHHAEFIGGAEFYVHKTASLLRQHGFHSDLLYDVRSRASRDFSTPFERVFPAVGEILEQIRSLAPDVIYIHRWERPQDIGDIVASGIPSARFYHDHDLFCLRRSKYKFLTQKACSKPVGLRCYPCLGFLRRDDQRKMTLRSVRSLRREQRANQPLSAHVVGSEYMLGQLVDHGFPKEHCHVNPLFAGLESSMADISPSARDRILFVGQMTRGKGVDLLLKSIPLMRSKAGLDLVGDGPQRAEFEALADELGIRNRVEFYGKMPRSELERRFHSAKCLVLPCRAPETFAMVGPEAMRFGVPSIATRIGGVSEWLKHGKTGLQVDPDSPEQLAAAVDQLFFDQGLHKSLSDGSKSAYESEFLPRFHVERLARMFSELEKGAR